MVRLGRARREAGLRFGCLKNGWLGPIVRFCPVGVLGRMIDDGSLPDLGLPVIHTLRKLAREIYRRSVLLVLIVYLAMSWGVLWVAGVLTNVVGLPAWTPGMTLVLLLIGLPITVATALVQGGLPGLRIVDFADPNELEGRTPEEVHVIPEAHPMYGVGVLTWRNAVLGGVMSAALLVTSVVAYLSMWALGIGPVGSLLAQGVLEENDGIIVAEFENRTDDRSLGSTVTDDFRADLSRSSIITLFDSRLVGDALRRMGRAPETRLTPEIARAMAVSEGAKAVVVGEIFRSDGGYLVSAGIMLPDGTLLARFRKTASDDARLGLAVVALSRMVREKLGESLRSIRRDVHND